MDDNDFQEASSSTEAEPLSVVGAALSIISTIIGGGIISIPYAMTAVGFKTGILIHVIMIILMMFCTHLYISARDYLKFDTISELCFMCFGRSSVFMINALVAFVIFGILTLYMLLFTKISLSLVTPLLSTSPDASLIVYIMESKITYILALTLFLLPVLLKRNLSELKFQSRILFFGIITLLIVLFIKQFEDTDIDRSAAHIGPDDYAEKFIDAINITITSYGFVINLFPIQSQMKDKKQSSVLLAVLLALLFCVFSYSLLTKLAINIYGENNIQQSIFDNLKQDSGILSVGIRGIFLVIFICNIPYLFFPGKLSILNILQEYRFRCFSKSLERAT